MARNGHRRWLRLRSGRSADVERELEEEIESHLAMRTEELVRRGESVERARAEAERRFGGADAARRVLSASARARESRLRRGARLDALRRDLSFGLRQMRRAPAYSAVVVATLALGIGLTTGMYTLVDRVLLRALPYPGSDRLVSLLSVDSTGAAFPYVSMGNWVDWRQASRTLEATALHFERAFAVGVGGEVRRVRGQRVVGPFFEVFGVSMVVGRPITEAEAQGSAPVAVVSESFWRANLGGDVSLSRALTVDGTAVQVVGVVPSGGAYPAETEVWMAARTRPEPGGMRNNVNWYGVARLREGVSLAQARSELGAIADGIRRSDPAGIYSWGVGVRPLAEAVVGDIGGWLLLLMAAVTGVLLIACVNLAGLGLARGLTRLQEVAVRVALGAGRGRVVRQLVTENFVLAGLGGVLGVALAWFGTRLVVRAYGAHIPRADEVVLDVRVVGFALLVTLLAATVAGLAPALKTSRANLRGMVGDERGAVRGGRGLPGAPLVVAEVALAFLLLTGGALLVRSFRAVLAQELGYDAQGVVAVDVALTGAAHGQDAPARIAYWNRLLERVRALPDVRAAGVANWIPTGSGGRSFIDVEGHAGGGPGAGYRVVSEGYFEALGVPLLSGRSFEVRDAEGERVALVNRRFVETYWPDVNPLGRRLRANSMEAHVPGGARWMTVIGVVDDVRHWGPERDIDPELYTYYRQLPDWTRSMTAVVRGDPARAGSLLARLRAEVTSLDPTLAVEVSLLDERVAALLGTRRLVLLLLTGFAALAVLLAAIGVYGMLSFAAAQRTREIGVRAALGARQAGILRLMLGSALRVVMVGVLLGLLGSFWATRLMAGLLFGVTAADPVSYAASAAILLAVALLAALLPAWRAARLDPLIALRRT